jgi:hypothetical protein
LPPPLPPTGEGGGEGENGWEGFELGRLETMKEPLKQISSPLERFEPWLEALAQEPSLQKLFIQRTSDKSLTVPHILYTMAPSV